METLHRFGQTLCGRTTDDLLRYLAACNAFKEPEEAKLRFE
jgi:hypothetical protein